MAHPFEQFMGKQQAAQGGGVGSAIGGYYKQVADLSNQIAPEDVTPTEEPSVPMPTEVSQQRPAGNEQLRQTFGQIMDGAVHGAVRGMAPPPPPAIPLPFGKRKVKAPKLSSTSIYDTIRKALQGAALGAISGAVARKVAQ